jgi:hypothetical protein
MWLLANDRLPIGGGCLTSPPPNKEFVSYQSMKCVLRSVRVCLVKESWGWVNMTGFGRSAVSGNTSLSFNGISKQRSLFNFDISAGGTLSDFLFRSIHLVLAVVVVVGSVLKQVTTDRSINIRAFHIQLSNSCRFLFFCSFSNPHSTDSTSVERKRFLAKTYKLPFTDQLRLTRNAVFGSIPARWKIQET